MTPILVLLNLCFFPSSSLFLSLFFIILYAIAISLRNRRVRRSPFKIAYLFDSSSILRIYAALYF
ncbi:hypothetical protein SAICODRAFT_28936 [Saitoella complicata NRRL Y-17804]|uniref:uncharacterized protein n=1 Tax=Saitoella complicata (strain BCRC 22490 / CBS 7301 / JCM 7358 / NBRC 10748 / NRRL Y-17804) TaxID=698492 RepID=UPI0008675AD2|nr:uncharacterized protein SAICODRAFT_28936 [Saitoella complicata NRRL Y-17804]ODQ55262.1 hypothetical protein SAICODRAFT_28936 [Saitoella complicata NRRL Y-17804]